MNREACALFSNFFCFLFLKDIECVPERPHIFLSKGGIWKKGKKEKKNCSQQQTLLVEHFFFFFLLLLLFILFFWSIEGV